MNDIEILEILKSIKEKCEHITSCDDCSYWNICNEMQGYLCDIYDDLIFLLKQENDIDILNYLKSIKEKCKEIDECAKCKYRHSCYETNGYPCEMYDNLMKLLNEEKKINNRSDEDENL